MPPAKKPARLSNAPLEKQKPGIALQAFWWIVFIIPMAFAWLAFQSLAMTAVIMGLRILVWVIPKFTGKKVPVQEPVKTPASPAPSKASINIPKNTLSPFIDEARSEWYWLLAKLHLYNEKEERNLMIYRKFRGWK